MVKLGELLRLKELAAAPESGKSTVPVMVYFEHATPSGRFTSAR